MRCGKCAKCQRFSDNLTKAYEPGFDHPIHVCSDDRTCLAIVEARQKQNPKMRLVTKLAAKYVTKEMIAF